MIKRIFFAITLATTISQAQPSLLTFAPNPTSSLGAQEAPAEQSTLKMGEAIKNKKFADDKDITDTKLKADSGSLSRYSLKFSLSYFGPPLGDITNEKQPNPDGSIGNTDTAIGGSVSFRYRFDSKSAVSMGTGINALTPFHGSRRQDVKTPFISYDRNARLAGFQVRNSYGASIVTQPEYISVGEYAGLSYDNSFIYDFGSSGVAAGVDTGFSYYLFNRGYEPADGKATTYTLGFYPQVKYNFSDKVNAYSSLALTFQNMRSRDEAFSLLNRTLSGRVGMGVAFSRDIYFAPYLNFYPQDLKTESTTISFSTIFSIL